MINKPKIKKYPFKQMQPGETFKLDDEDVRNAQKMAWYYRFPAAIIVRHPVYDKITQRTGKPTGPVIYQPVCGG